MFHPRGPTFLELVQQALSSTERGYDLLAPKFDYTPFRTPDAILETAIGLVGEVDTALDVCCGTGAAMRLLRPRCRASVVGVDRSVGMMNVGRPLLEQAPGSAPFHFVRADALALPFEQAFDAAVSAGAFGHILQEDEPRFVRSVYRALKPGGRFVFVTSTIPSVRTARYWIARTFNAAMHVRNALWRPQFIMYYLTFLWPGVKPLLEAAGFRVEAQTGLFDPPFENGVVVVATRPAR